MEVGGTGKSPGQMWDVETGGKGTRCGRADLSPKSPFKPGSGKCSSSHASTHTPTAGCRLDFKGHKSNREQSNSELYSFFLKSLVLVGEGQLYNFSLIHAFSYTQMTKK